MTRNEILLGLKSIAASEGLYDDKNPRKKTLVLGEAIKLLEQELEIKALGEELRSVRNSIKDEKTLVGYNLAVAICNKYLSDSEV